MKLEVVDYFYITTVNYLLFVGGKQILQVVLQPLDVPMPHGAMALPALVPGRDWRRCGHWSGLCRAASLLGLAPWGTVERVRRCRFSGHFLVS